MDNIIFLILLTPIFFACGWFAARVDIKSVINQSKSIPKRIFDVIDKLVNNQTGLAADNLLEITIDEPNLIDLKFYLGKLYRARGENDLAIKLHTKLLNSHYLINNEQKDKVKLELAEDFKRAGLIDRAESLLLGLQDNVLYNMNVQKMLLDIYQQDKNWLKAIEIAKKITNTDHNYHVEIAHFYCELANEAMIKSNYELTKQYLEEAFNANRKCVRANIIYGELYYLQERYLDAIIVMQNIEKQNPEYLTMAVDRLATCYMALDKVQEFVVLINGYNHLYPQLMLFSYMSNNNIIAIGFSKLIDNKYKQKLLEENVAKPNYKLAIKLLDEYSVGINFEQRLEFEYIKATINSYYHQTNLHRCLNCNFKSKTFFWHCPACYSWETINPNIQ